MDKAIPIYSNCDIQENILYYYCSECKGEIEISNILPVSLPYKCDHCGREFRWLEQWLGNKNKDDVEKLLNGK